MIATNFAYTHYQVIPCIFAMIFGEFTLAYHGNAKIKQVQIVSPHTEIPHLAYSLISLILSLFENSTNVQCKLE